jgi:2-polyprenyl-3-methyl-5-hydroxy-6-metoxy-1,4-benzoquinol methylase
MKIKMMAIFVIAVLSTFVSISTSTTTGSVSNNVGSSSLEMFRNSWSTYKTVVHADLMEHKSLTVKITEAIHHWIDSVSNARSSAVEDIAIADLGCGDLALLAPLYKSLPLKTFCGVDMSLSALTLAQAAFSASSDLSASSKPRTLWLNDDLLNWAKTIEVDQTAGGSLSSEHSGIEKFDIILCAFSVHHVNDEDKQRFLTAIVNNKLKAGGMILMADIFRIENEDRDSYIERFASHIEVNWGVITATQKIEVLKHVRENDFPASLDYFMLHTAPECGLSCELLWSDTGDFEKLLMMRRI